MNNFNSTAFQLALRNSLRSRSRDGNIWRLSKRKMGKKGSRDECEKSTDLLNFSHPGDEIN